MMRRMVRAALVLLALTAVASAKPKPKERWQELPMPPEPPAPAAHGEVEVDGAQIYYETYGKGSPVILLHGGLGSGNQFGFQVPALADKYQVISIDTRGHGRSTLTKQVFSYHLFAGDVLAVMDKLALKSAAIVGWSDGGEIGIDLAINHPERIAKLFVIGANYDVHGSKSRGDHTPTFEAYGVRCHHDYAKLSKTPKAWENLVDAMTPVWHTATVFTKEQLRTITTPTMITDGDHDEIIVIDQEKEMAGLVQHGEFLAFENASHFVMWQDPASVNKALLEFLGEP